MRSYVGTIAVVGYFAMAVVLATYDWILALMIVVVTAAAVIIAAGGVVIGRKEASDGQADTAEGAPRSR